MLTQTIRPGAATTPLAPATSPKKVLPTQLSPVTNSGAVSTRVVHTSGTAPTPAPAPLTLQASPAATATAQPVTTTPATPIASTPVAQVTTVLTQPTPTSDNSIAYTGTTAPATTAATGGAAATGDMTPWYKNPVLWIVLVLAAIGGYMYFKK